MKTTYALCSLALHIKVTPSWECMAIIDDINRIKLRVKNEFVKDGVYGACLIGSIVLKEVLAKYGIETTLNMGYLCNHRVAALHVYLMTLHGVVDIGTEITIKLEPRLQETNWDIKDDYPPYLERIDSEAERVNCMRLFEMYNKDPCQYWKDAPPEALELRKRVFQSVRKCMKK